MHQLMQKKKMKNRQEEIKNEITTAQGQLKLEIDEIQEKVGNERDLKMTLSIPEDVSKTVETLMCHAVEELENEIETVKRALGELQCVVQR